MIPRSHTSFPSHGVARYGLALAIVVAAVMARVALVPVIGLNVPYVTIYPAIMIVAVVLGAGPGMFAALVGILLAEHQFMRTGLGIDWNLALAVRSAIVLGASLYIGWVGRRLRAARAKAEAESAAAQTARETESRLGAELATRASELEASNASLRDSRVAAINLMQDAITARKQMEDALDALRKAHERLALAQQSAGAGMWDWDMTTEKLEWSPEMFRLFGLDPSTSEATFDTWRRILHPEDRDAAAERIREAVQNHARLESEYRIVLGSGEQRWISALGEAVYGAGGRPLRMSGICVDITERRGAETALRQSEERLRLVLRASKMGTFEVDLVTGEGQWNAVEFELLGLKPGDASPGPESFFRFVHPEDVGPLKAQWQQALRSGVLDAEFRVVRADGEVRWLAGKGQFIFQGRDGAEARGRALRFMGMNFDITERKWREDRLERLNRALKALGHSGQALIRATSEAEFLNEACQIIVQDCGYAMVWIGFAENDKAQSIRPAAYAGFEAGYLETLDLTWADAERGRGPTGTAVRTGQVCRCLNMLTDPRFLPWRAEAIKRGYASSIALPLMAGDKAFGALTLYSREPGGFAEEEVRLLTDLAADFAQGIASFRTRAAQELAERAVRESEERYRTLFSTMTEGFALHEIICDSEGKPCDYRFLDINPAFEHLTGLKRDHVIGKTVLEVMPETEPIWIDRYGRVALTGEPDHFQHASKELHRHYEVTACRTAPGRFAVIFSDVTELRAMQAREKEDAIRLAWGQSAIDTINAMLDGVVLLELNGTITSINPAVERMTGLDGGAVVGRNIESILPKFMGPDDLRKARRGLAVLRRGGIPGLIPPSFLTRPDGKVIHVLPSLSLMDAAEGGRRLVVLTLKDVTELYEATLRLEQGERKYRELVQNANSIIMRISPDHTIAFFNEYGQKFFGYEAEEVLGRNVIGTIVPEVDSEGRDLRELMRAITAAPEVYATNENESMCKDGSRVWVHWANRAVRDDQGNVVEILCVGTDVTRRRELEADALRYQQRLMDLAERLAATEEEDRWRISRYIHDTIIQNLALSCIRLASLAKPLTVAKLKEEADKLRQIGELIEQAIDECRMVMSDLTPALLYELGLGPALNDLARQLEAKHGARVIVEDDGREASLSNSLRGLLFQSVRELVMNALKHAGPCEIRVVVSSRDSGLVIRVVDNGEGFDAAGADLQTNRHAGFGLFSIRQRLEGLGGRLDIESAPGKGTTATISVPLSLGDGEPAT